MQVVFIFKVGIAQRPFALALARLALLWLCIRQGERD